jgi:3-hydroxyacyl-CoA dehydrogenase
MPRTSIHHGAVVGTGVIGASWAACFLARGLTVSATDPAPDAEAKLRAAVAAHWPVLEQFGLAEGALPNRLTFHAEPERAVEAADFVQENGPEREDLKQDLFRRLDAAAAPDVILSTSSSGLLVSRIQTACRNPERVVLGHPFNPPHLIPLVEVVGGEQTSPEVVDAAMAFYASIGKRPIRLRREIKGHVANRLQAALWREAFSLVESGVATVADIDTAIAHGPGLRWAILGPFVNLHLSGGSGGIAHVINHLGPGMETWWNDIGSPRLTPELRDKVAEGVAEELAQTAVPAMTQARDAILMELIRRKAESDKLP